jgi:DeoR/GlpR family transcriptional regulator of sugar metabolism
VLATALAEAFSTSEDTIWRDLRDLAGRGLCCRVYGGALPALLGVCALDPVAGAAAFDPEDSEIKRALLCKLGPVAAGS